MNIRKSFMKKVVIKIGKMFLTRTLTAQTNKKLMTYLEKLLLWTFKKSHMFTPDKITVLVMRKIVLMIGLLYLEVLNWIQLDGDWVLSGLTTFWPYPWVIIKLQICTIPHLKGNFIIKNIFRYHEDLQPKILAPAKKNVSLTVWIIFDHPLDGSSNHKCQCHFQ